MRHVALRAIARSSLLALLLAGASAPARTHADSATPLACPEPGVWLTAGDGERLAADEVIAEAAGRAVVLLGETHTNTEHHRWQLHSLAALHARRPDMVIGFETSPRRVQPVLDRWVAGELTTEAFLRDVEWSEVWGIDPGLYLPLFHFARIHRVPMVALNVERALISRVGQEGWAAIPDDAREGLGDPAAADPAYVDVLVQSWLAHRPPTDANQDAGTGDGDGTDVDDSGETDDSVPAATEAAAPDPADIKADPRFQRFVEAQLAWDRAMAEAVAMARQRAGAPLVVGVLGSGHLRLRHGVPHQLVDLGIDDTRVLLPLDVDADCEVPQAGFADALFALAPPAPSTAEPAKPRLGVFIETGEDGVEVSRLVEGSVAEASGLVAGDVIVEAAGQPVAESGQLIEVVQRQALGTWLPLSVRRGRVTLEIVAKFPAAVEGHP